MNRPTFTTFTYVHDIFRSSSIVGALCCGVLAGAIEFAYAQEDAAVCAARTPRDAAIAACTRRIESGQLQAGELALAYLNRAQARLPYPPQAELASISDDLDKAISLNPNDADAYWTRASLFGWNHREQGIADYAKVIDLRPDRFDAYFQQAILLEYTDLDRAIANYSKIHELKPDWKPAEVYGRRARAYELKGENQRALADLGELIRIQPDEEPYSRRGFIYLRLHDYDRAIEDFNNGLSIRNLHPTPMLGLLRAYEAKGDFEQALKQANANISLLQSRGFTSVSHEYVDRARIHLKMGRTTDALADADAVLRANQLQNQTEYLRVHLLRGRIYEAMGRTDEAMAEFRRIQFELATSRGGPERETLDEAIAGLKRLGAMP